MGPRHKQGPCCSTSLPAASLQHSSSAGVALVAALAESASTAGWLGGPTSLPSTVPCSHLQSWRQLSEKIGLALLVRNCPLHGRRWHTQCYPGHLLWHQRQVKLTACVRCCCALPLATIGSSCYCVATQLISLFRLHARCLGPLTHSQRQLLALRLICHCRGCCAGQLLAALAAGEDHMDHHLRHESPTTIKQRQSARRRSPGR